MKEKNLELERMVFFSDAIVAIAITLLVFGLKIDLAPNAHLTFAAIAGAWQRYCAFFLSFFIIAVFWKIHHEFFHYICKVNGALLWYNIIWLLFIVLLPFTSSLVSMYFLDKPAIVIYCANILLITIFQNNVWDYVAKRPEFLKDIDEMQIRFYRRACNVAMLNAIVALVLAFFHPIVAFIILLARLPMILLTRRFYKYYDSQQAPNKTE